MRIPHPIIFCAALGLAITLQTATFAADSGDRIERRSWKPKPEPTVDMDRFYSDPCYESNCGRESIDPTAQARVAAALYGTRSASSSFLVMEPSYPAGVTCTSLYGEVSDNNWLTVLAGTITVGSSGVLSMNLSAEPRVQRRDGSSTSGIGAIGARIRVADHVAVSSLQAETTAFVRWILHSPVNHTVISDVPNPNSVNQPVITTNSVDRHETGLTPGADYDVYVDFKWSDVYTGLELETRTAPFATGQRGAIVCVPQLILETW